MTVDAAIPVLFWGVVVVVFLVLVLRALARRYPGAALKPFGSSRDVGAYFGFAREIFRFDARLIRYPVYLTILNYAVYLPGWLYVRARLLAQHGPLPPRGVIDLPFLAVTPSGLASEFLQAAGSLPYGYLNLLTGSVAILILTLVATLACGRFTGMLRRRTGTESPGGLRFLERALKALRQVILLAGLLVVVALVLGLPGFAFAFCLVLTLVLSIATLLMVSLIQGLVFNYVTDYIGGRRSDYGNLLGRSLTSLESLFRLNVVLYIGLALGALIVFPFSLQTELYSFMGAGTPGDPSVPFWLAVRVARYFSPIFALATVCAPFFLVAGGLGVRQTLRVNFGFIGRHFLKYLTLLAVSTCLLFIPRLLRVLLGTVFLPMTAPDFVIRFILALLSVIIAVRVFLAVFRFHHDYAQR